MADTHQILLRYSGEIATKAPRTRAQFERRLRRAVRDALRAEDIPGEVRRTRDRLYVHTEHGEALDVLSRVFGVQSAARAEAHPADKLDRLVGVGRALFGDVVAGRRFAVRVRRVGERGRIPLASRDVERALGTALLPGSAGVDLGAPEVTVRIELREDQAYFLVDERRGPGGLPVGVEGRAIALVSGGFDSAVAAWAMQRRGVGLDYLFCNLGGAAHQLGVTRVVKALADRWGYGARPHLHAVDFDAVAREIRERVDTRYWQIVLKRQMLRAGERVAREREALALVTGDSVGQVSSQTLPNLAAVSQATALPILRPLVGWNKDEIVLQADRIGTGPLSAVVDEYCAMVPGKPATSAPVETVLEQEAALDPSLLERAVAERAVFDLRALDPEAQGIPELETTGIPPGATVLDLRSSTAFAAWHWPDALRLDFDRALAAYPSFERGRTYVCYCEFGLKSAHLAELMRAAGFDAWHFRGGLEPLLRHAAQRGLPVPDAYVLG